MGCLFLLLPFLDFTDSRYRGLPQHILENFQCSLGSI